MLKNFLIRLQKTSSVLTLFLLSRDVNLITTLSDSYNKMPQELRSVQQPAYRKYFEDEIENFRNEHSKAIKKMRQKLQMASTDKRSRQEQELMDNAERSKNINDQLDEAIVIGNDTNMVGGQALETPADDRKHLEHIDQNLDKIKQEAKSGQKTAGAMLRRKFLNELFPWHKNKK